MGPIYGYPPCIKRLEKRDVPGEAPGAFLCTILPVNKVAAEN
jgi:hypothetical protein